MSHFHVGVREEWLDVHRSVIVHNVKLTLLIVFLWEAAIKQHYCKRRRRSDNHGRRPIAELGWRCEPRLLLHSPALRPIPAQVPGRISLSRGSRGVQCRAPGRAAKGPLAPGMCNGPGAAAASLGGVDSEPEVRLSQGPRAGAAGGIVEDDGPE